MKKGWQTKKLVDVATLQRGFDLPTQDRSSGDVPLVTSSGISDTVSKSAVHGPGAATGRSGSIGNVFFIEGDFWPLNTVLYVKDFHGNDPRFVFHLLKNFDLKRFATGTGVPTLNRNFVHDELVPVPPLAEQQRIVGLLDEAFEGLATAKANAEKNLQNARALFESHLQSVFTQRGPGWVEKRLVEVSREFGRGKSKHRPCNEPKLYDGPYPFIQTGDISNADHWLTDYSQTYSELGLAQSRLWPKGTICIAIVGATVGETAILDFESCFPDSVIGIVVNDELADNEYVEFLLQSFKALLKEKGKGTARDNINLGTFENQMFPFPPLKKQKAIVATLNSLREETQRLARLYERKHAALEAVETPQSELILPKLQEDGFKKCSK